MPFNFRDTHALNALRPKVEAALADLAKDLGIVIKAGKINYSADNCTLQVTFANVGEGGVVLSKEATDFKRMAKLYGLEPEDLGRTFKWGGKEFTITGLAARAARFPILGKDALGRTFKFPKQIAAFVQR